MKLRDYQSNAVEAAIKSEGNPIIALPTGAGKSLVLADLARQIPGDIYIISHVKEILEQNHKACSNLLDEPVGLWSAGLGVKNKRRVTVAGIHSIYKQNLEGTLIIDECHLVTDHGMYGQVIQDQKVIGLTATPFRMKDGYLHDGPIFTEICYNAEYNKLVEDGWLSPIKYFGDKDQFKVDGLRITGGDYNVADMSLHFDREAVTDMIINKLIIYKSSYKHWLLFAIDIAHAEHIAQALTDVGISAKAVHSKSPRDQAIEDFKAGKIQALVNVNILTTGFDAPFVDLIVMLRPTKSPVLHVQAIGRGLRIAPGKDHCLVKDFAGNTARLGPIDEVQVVPENKGKGKGKQRMKTCPECDYLLSPAAKVCENCGHTFKFKHNLRLEAHAPTDGKSWYDVKDITYHLYHKPGKPTSLKVTYICGLARTFTEWVLLDHGGYPAHIAKYWVSRRWKHNEPMPTSTMELYTQASKLWKPKKIEVEEGGKYPKILRIN